MGFHEENTPEVETEETLLKGENHICFFHVS